MQQAGATVESEEDDGTFHITSVIADRFCESNTKEVIVKKKYDRLFIHQRYKMLDTNGKVLLKVKGSSLSLHKKRVMRDTSGSVIVTMRQKVMLKTLRHRWTVHRGKSSDEKDVIFKVERSHPLEMKARLEVFMAENNDNNNDDVTINDDGDDNKCTSSFELVKTYSDLCCKIYRGESVIAEVTEGLPTRKFFKYKEMFRVKIGEGVDYAFIFGLLAIFTVNDYI